MSEAKNRVDMHDGVMSLFSVVSKYKQDSEIVLNGVWCFYNLIPIGKKRK
jgi:hypothetical protein